MKVYCTSEHSKKRGSKYNYLTKLRSYEVIDMTKNFIIIKDDSGHVNRFPLDCFNHTQVLRNLKINEILT